MRPTLHARNRVADIAGQVLLFLACCLLVMTGVLGFKRATEPLFDVRYWVTSARAFAAGIDPYDFDAYQSVAASLGLVPIERFAYPPQGFGFYSLFSFLPYPAARWTFAGLTLVALAALIAWLVRRIQQAGGSRALACTVAAFVVASPPVSNSVFTGQMSIIIVACLLFGLEAARRGWWHVSGVMLAVASIKPQLSIFVLVWLVLERQWKVLGATVVAVVVMAAVPLMHYSPSHLLHGWLRSVGEYQHEPTKEAGLTYNTTLSSLARAFDLPSPGTAVCFLVGALVVVLVHRRWRGKSSDQARASGPARVNDPGQAIDLGLLIPLLSGIGLLLISGRDYDMAPLIPLALGWAVSRYRHERAHAVAVVLMLMSFAIPHRLVERMHVPVLLYWRIVVLALLVAVLATVAVNLATLATRPRPGGRATERGGADGVTQ